MDQVIRLRRATADDVAAIRRLVREAYAPWVPVIGREPRPMGADYAAAVRDHRFDLLLLDDVLAGLVETIDEGDGLLVENLAVSPEFQRRGLGSQLMAHTEALALALGHRRIRLFTNQRFASNIALYRRLGYRVEVEVGLGGGTIRVDMSKSLQKSI